MSIAGMLIVFLSLIALVNYLLNDILGQATGLNKWISQITNGQHSGLSLQFIIGYLLSPLAWLMGVCKDDMTLVGQLLGEKVIMNEFVGYVSLADLKATNAFAQQK